MSSISVEAAPNEHYEDLCNVVGGYGSCFVGGNRGVHCVAGWGVYRERRAGLIRLDRREGNEKRRSPSSRVTISHFLCKRDRPNL
jgi:hypothetical protein